MVCFSLLVLISEGSTLDLEILPVVVLELLDQDLWMLIMSMLVTCLTKTTTWPTLNNVRTRIFQKVVPRCYFVGSGAAQERPQACFEKYIDALIDLLLKQNIQVSRTTMLICMPSQKSCSWVR